MTDWSDLKFILSFYKESTQNVYNRFKSKRRENTKPNGIINRISLFFVATLFFSPSHASLPILNKCRGFFQIKSVQYSLHHQNKTLQNSYSQLIFEQVYQQIPLLEETTLSIQEKQKYILQLEKLIQNLEKNSLQTNNRLLLLDPYLTPALKNTPDIISFIKSDSALKYESLDAKTVLQLILSTLSQHLMSYLKHPHSQQLDWPRIKLILKSISNFQK